MKKISQLAIGEQARVINVEGTDRVSRRLMEMGLTAGVNVEVIGLAPLGDPLELRVRGYRLCVRSTEADRVQVESA